MFKKRLVLRYVLLALGISGWAAAAMAQRPEPDAFLNQQRAITDLIRQEREKLSPVTEDTQFDYGGSYSFFLFLYDDGVNSSRTFRRHDLRLWARLGLDKGAHEFYARGRLSFVDFNPGDQFEEEDDVDGMNLERGFYKFDLAKAMLASSGTRIDYNVEFKIGRDFTQFGTGYALSTPLDQVLLRATLHDLELTGLMGKTIGSSQDFDQVRNPERTRRTFFGLQAKYRGLARHEPFAYVLWQRDHNRDVVPDTVQKFDYDSFYVGLGSTGEIVPRLRYSTEWVAETGRSFSSGATVRRNNIAAWAWDLELEYLFNYKGRPRVGFEYMFASGDADRIVSPTSTIGGNSKGFKDTSFIGFGFRDTGLSFAPRLSNVHIWRLGGSFYPLEDHPKFNRLQLGTNWFLYHKHRSNAAVSDPTATDQSGYLGWEMDYFANWEVTTDFSATARYGVFFPGDAFPDETTRTFLLLGFTWNF
ncbi:MAG: alginate export family protein [Phycisphaerae bacterium]